MVLVQTLDVEAFPLATLDVASTQATVCARWVPSQRGLSASTLTTHHVHKYSQTNAIVRTAASQDIYAPLHQIAVARVIK